MADVPETVASEAPASPAAAEAEPAAAPMSPAKKLQRHALFAELACLAMQLVCMLDDIDDKVRDDASLLVDMNLTQAEMDRALRFHRKLLDRCRCAQSVAFEEITALVAVGNVGKENVGAEGADEEVTPGEPAVSSQQ